ncbi:MAG: oligosaccharide flippase family protein [Ruminococcus sp.]
MKVNQLKLGAILSYVNLGIGTIIPMFYTPVMLRLMGQAEYGLYNLAASVTSYLSLITFGIGSAIVRYLTKLKTENDKEGFENMFGLFNVIFRTIALITLLSGIGIAIAAPYFYSDSLGQDIGRFQLLIIILSFNMFFSLIFTVYTSVVTVYEKFIFYQVMNIISTSLSPCLNIVVLFMGFKSVGLAFVALPMMIFSCILYIYYVRNKLHIKPRYNNMPISLIKEILFFSFWVFLANVVNQLYSTTDKLIIGAVPVLATTGVAIYNIGTTFTNIVLQLSMGVSSVLTPKVNTMVFSGSDNRQLTDLVIRIGRIQMYIVMIVVTGFIAFGRQFIQFWAGDGYQEAYWVALVTMIPACVPLVQGVALQIIVAQNRHRFRSLVYLGIAVGNVIGTYLLVNSFGIIGAAVVTGVANIIGQGFIMNWYYWKKIGLEIPRFWKSLLNITVCPIIMCVVFLIISYFVDFYNPAVMLAGIIVYTILFIVTQWRFAMNDYEKNIFRAPVMKVVNKFRKKEA